MSKLGVEVNLALRDFVNNTGNEVLGAMIIHRNGFVISSVMRDSINAKSLSAVFAAVKGTVDRILSKSGIGNTNLLLFRASKYLITMYPINNEVVLVSLAREDSNLGLILMSLDYVKERIEKILYQ
ncbi:MAG: roadblock/LC7 domain-containing protein [Vulcanisaeta sp.]|jgi:predicted regulator of Ras-like GTPase activity (Roadblock/LC7/MglB family)|uniref:roadblock/LC7 domain-containing protein n=1 Tax=Vulcanisaeta sp. TaxID=2020871 RepID=UPI003D123EE6